MLIPKQIGDFIVGKHLIGTAGRRDSLIPKVPESTFSLDTL